MTRPPGMQTFQVRIRPAQALGTGTALRTIVRFTPSTSAVWAATRTALIAFCETSTAEAEQELLVELPSPDQAGFIDGRGNTVRGWTYRAEVTHLDGDQVVARTRTDLGYTAAMVSPVDLAAVVPVPSASGTAIAIPVIAGAHVDAGQLVLVDATGAEVFRGAVGGSSSGPAGGFLAGQYPNPGVNETALDNAVSARVKDSTSKTAAALAAAYVTKAELSAVGGGFQYLQSTAAASWSISHAFGRRPTVELYTLAGERIFSDVTATTSAVYVTFPTPISGYAVLT